MLDLVYFLIFLLLWSRDLRTSYFDGYVLGADVVELSYLTCILEVSSFFDAVVFIDGFMTLAGFLLIGGLKLLLVEVEVPFLRGVAFLLKKLATGS